ncbi:MAG: hypothetical protein MK171_13710, partial [Pirellulales bacterium]|nr:hypothetical protein [Pirellulales bacterium]
LFCRKNLSDKLADARVDSRHTVHGNSSTTDNLPGSGLHVALLQIDRFIHDGVRTTPASKDNQTRALGALHAL